MADSKAGKEVDKKAPKRRRSRADGELSRVRILDAATEIAAERGYEGTSIALVSAKCGLPASSIYWHFKDKDDLIAAVIERSFGSWLSAWQIPENGGQDARYPGAVRGAGGSGRQSAVGFARLHPARADAGTRAPPNRTPRSHDVRPGSRPGI